MHSRTHVMQKAGQCELRCARPSADARLALEHSHLEPGPSQDDCCGKAIRARPDNHSVEISHAR